MNTTGSFRLFSSAVAFALCANEALPPTVPLFHPAFVPVPVIWPGGDVDSAFTVLVPAWSSAATSRAAP
jgi:hypothetical protein